MHVAKFSSATQPALSLNLYAYNNPMPVPFTNARIFQEFGRTHHLSNQSTILNNFWSAQNLPILPTTCTVAGCISQYMLDKKDDYKASMYGAYSFVDLSLANGHISKIVYIPHANFTGLHAAPLFSALITDATVRTFNSKAGVNTQIHPLPLTAQEQSVSNSFSLSTLIDFILFGIAFCPSAFIGFVVGEKQVKSKYQQMVSGVSIPAYWLTTWVWDNANYWITMWMIIIIIVSDTNNTKNLTDGDAMGVTIGVFILFGMAATSFCYLMSFMFRQAAFAQVAGVFAFLLSGLIFSLVGIFLRIFESTRSYYLNGIKYAFALFPPFCLGDCLLSLTLISIWSTNELSPNETYKVTAWKISGLNLTFLAWETVIYLGLTIAIDYGASMPMIQVGCNQCSHDLYFNYQSNRVYL